MDGDLAPLPELPRWRTSFDAWLLSDDAHGIGVVGDGRGSTFATARSRRAAADGHAVEGDRRAMAAISARRGRSST